MCYSVCCGGGGTSAQVRCRGSYLCSRLQAVSPLLSREELPPAVYTKPPSTARQWWLRGAGSRDSSRQPPGPPAAASSQYILAVSSTPRADTWGGYTHTRVCVVGGWFKEPHLARVRVWGCWVHTCGALGDQCPQVKPAITTHTSTSCFLVLEDTSKSHRCVAATIATLLNIVFSLSVFCRKKYFVSFFGA